jgi:pyruvate formate lyase activating enzyme
MSGAIEKIGNQTDVDTVMKEVLADVQYFRHSGGGMTLSGGEPLMQPAFSLALLQSARSYNIHTAVETSGYGKREDLQAMLPFIDLFLWDIKMTKSELHRKYTGVSFLPILNNLRYAADNGANIVLRILYIPKLHDNVIYIKTLSEIMSSLNCKPELEIIPIHRFGVAKLQKLGLKEEYVFREPTPEQINCFKSKIRIR